MKKFLAVIFIFILLFSLTSCGEPMYVGDNPSNIILSSSASKVESTLEPTLKWVLPSDVYLYEKGEIDIGSIYIIPFDFNDDDITFISNNPTVATITKGDSSSDYLYYVIEAVSNGVTQVYAQTSDGEYKSTPLNVNVNIIDTSPLISSSSESSISSVITNNESTTSKSGETSNNIVTDNNTTSTNPTEESPKTESSQKVENNDYANGTRVYVTPTGKRYHYDPECGGKNSRETTLENAISSGLTPCKKCAGG